MKTLYFLLFLIIAACQNTELPDSKTEISFINFEQDEPQDTTHTYPWYRRLKPENMLVNRITPPKGYSRIKVKKGSFAHWLRHLPLKKPNSKVYYYNDQEKHTQEIHEGVIDIDVGNNDLQKSEDAVIRLRAEYLFAQKRFAEIEFITQNQDTLALNAISKEPTYKQFRRYLDALAALNSPLSFSESLNFINLNELAIGDVFVQPADPGHAAIIVDLAENEARQQVFLLAQAFTPAQDIHIIKNFDNAQIFQTWYPTNFGTTLYTPEWEFTINDLMRFR
jgi:hypothetical protein